MYYYEFNSMHADYDIFDTEGARICTVKTKMEAEALLSHLNR